jgi:hypothetical protein
MMRSSSLLHLHRSPLLPLFYFSYCSPSLNFVHYGQTFTFESRSYFSTSSPSTLSSHQVSSPLPSNPPPSSASPGLLMTTRKIEVHTPAGLVELDIPVLEISLRDLVSLLLLSRQSILEPPSLFETSFPPSSLSSSFLLPPSSSLVVIGYS